MNKIRFIYLYRDGANYKSWGEVIFDNPEQLSVDEIDQRLGSAFLSKKLFVAHQISLPEKFLFLDGKITRHDHCYHEFDSIEVCEEQATDLLSRSITKFIAEVELISRLGWKAFDVLERI